MSSGIAPAFPSSLEPAAELAASAADFRSILDGWDETVGDFRYAPGKWSVKEVLVHVTDFERVFAYRALRFARGDRTDLPGFDCDSYVARANSGERSLATLLDEFEAVRGASVAFFRHVDAPALALGGTASGVPYTVAEILALLVRHQAHHVVVLRERYLAAIDASPRSA